MTTLQDRLARKEVIVVDGGSTDGSVDIIKKYARIRSEMAIAEGDEKFPPDFPLRDIVEEYDRDGSLRGLLTTTGRTKATKTPDSTRRDSDPREGAPPEPAED